MGRIWTKRKKGQESFTDGSWYRKAARSAQALLSCIFRGWCFTKDENKSATNVEEDGGVRAVGPARARKSGR